MQTLIIPAAIASENLTDQVHIGIESMSITYVQPADTNSNSEEVQALKVTADDASCVTTEEFMNTHKSGMYLSIQTDRWSIDSPDTLKFILNDFQKRLNIISCKD